MINYETFESNFNAHWYFKDFISGFIVVVCDDIFSLLSEQEQQLHQQRLLVFTFENLYEFELSE